MIFSVQFKHKIRRKAHSEAKKDNEGDCLADLKKVMSKDLTAITGCDGDGNKFLVPDS